jgi:phosphate/sulfate permease
MNASSVSPIKIASIILMVAGAGLILWGYQLSDSIGSQITEVVTGAAADKVMMHYIMGAASFVVGLYLFAKK